MQIPEIVTYHSTNNKPEWFAYCKPSGEFLGVRFEGSSEAEAIERAKNWWVNEKGRQNRLEGRVELDDDEVDSKPYKQDEGWGGVSSNDWGKAPSTHGLAGKVWLVNKTLKEKKRVDPSEVAGMMANGWERGGPRTVV